MHKLEDILFIDIETVSQSKSYEELPERVQHIWEKKHSTSPILNQFSVEESYTQKAAIFSEYGKIICISVGMYDKTNDEFRLKSFFGKKEKNLLSDFENFCSGLKRKFIFCGHNIKEFDIPYLCRRLLINQISIPKSLDFQDKKPWEIEMIDTLQLWKFGDYKNYTSLETLTTIFDIPTPKNDIDGSQVGGVYWIEDNLERIVTYCQQDVIAVIQLYRKIQLQEILEPNKFIIVD
jgi:3'-5' exonuclease